MDHCLHPFDAVQVDGDADAPPALVHFEPFEPKTINECDYDVNDSVATPNPILSNHSKHIGPY